MTGIRDKMSFQLAYLLVPLVSTVASSHSLYFCNRGFCYTKKEPDHLNNHLHTLNLQKADAPKLRSGINFCTDSHGHVMDCELFEILGMDQDEVDAEYEALECRPGANCDQKEETGDADPASTLYYATADGGVIELDEEMESSGHISWKENPMKGRCFDNDTHYSFDCNLVQILDEGLVLIEDLRAGGVFAAQPKSGFTTQKSEKGIHRHEQPRTPHVLQGSGPTDPAEDFRTNVFLNLEGI